MKFPWAKKPAPICPYCQHVLSKEIKRKTACEDCGNPIFVRKGNLMREEEVLLYDWQQFFIQMGYPNDILDHSQKELRRRFNQEPSAKDVVWATFNELLKQEMRQSSYHKLSMLYFSMGNFLLDQKKPDRSQAISMFKLASQMRAQDYKSGGIKSIQILANSTEACEACAKSDGKIIPVDDFINNPAVPVVECKNVRCSCTILPVTPLSKI